MFGSELDAIWEYSKSRPTRIYYSKDLSPETSRSSSEIFLDPFLTQIQDGFPIELLPNEILFMIFELLDSVTLFNCMYVNKRWKCLALTVLNADKNNERWNSIMKRTIHQHQNTIVQKTKNLSWNDFFANSIRWCHIKSALIKCIHTNKMKMIKKINVYKDNIIVVQSEGVTYFDAKTNEIRRQLPILHSYEYLETDDMIIKGTESSMLDGTKVYRLEVFGKSKPSDSSLQEDAAIALQDITLFYRVDKNNCYMLNSRHIVYRYTWIAKDHMWQLKSVGRFFGAVCGAIAMNVLNSELYMLLCSGKMMAFNQDTRNFERGMNIRMPLNSQKLLVTLVHLFCIVFGVPADREFRITRYKNNLRGNTFFKFECPNLSCAMEHGEMLFLGYNDGKVEIFMPRAPERSQMFKRRINIADFDKESLPEHRAVVAIDVFEDVDRHHLFVATATRMFNFLITYIDNDVWINAEFPEILPLCSRPVRMRFEL